MAIIRSKFASLTMQLFFQQLSYLKLNIKTDVSMLFSRKGPTMGRDSLMHHGDGVQDPFKKENTCRLILAMFRQLWAL
jgi:hypothetical protein